MGRGIETEDVESTGAEGLIFVGFGEYAETDGRLPQDIKVTLNEIGIEFLLSIEETKNLLLISKRPSALDLSFLVG